MGVENYLSEHPEGEKEIRLSDLNLEKKKEKTKAEFDFDEAITGEHIEKIIEITSFNSANAIEFPRMLRVVKLVCPEEADKIRYRDTDELVFGADSERDLDKRISESLKHYYDEGNWATFMQNAFDYYVIFSKKVEDYEFDDMAWEHVDSDLQSYTEDENLWDLVRLAACAKVYFPEKDSGKYVEENWDKIKPWIEKYRSQGSWSEFTKFTTFTRMVSEDKFNETQLPSA